jgi:hypothetical protein
MQNLYLNFLERHESRKANYLEEGRRLVEAGKGTRGDEYD